MPSFIRSFRFANKIGGFLIFGQRESNDFEEDSTDLHAVTLVSVPLTTGEVDESPSSVAVRSPVKDAGLVTIPGAGDAWSGFGLFGRRGRAVSEQSFAVVGNLDGYHPNDDLGKGFDHSSATMSGSSSSASNSPRWNSTRRIQQLHLQQQQQQQQQRERQQRERQQRGGGTWGRSSPTASSLHSVGPRSDTAGSS